jgi:hypothetical protein
MSVARTSRETFSEIQNELQPMERQVMSAFRGDENLRLTRQRIADITKLPLSGVCGRVNSLLEKGKLQEFGHIREAGTNKPRALLGLAQMQRELFS